MFRRQPNLGYVSQSLFEVHVSADRVLVEWSALLCILVKAPPVSSHEVAEGHCQFITRAVALDPVSGSLTNKLLNSPWPGGSVIFGHARLPQLFRQATFAVALVDNPNPGEAQDLVLHVLVERHLVELACAELACADFVTL
jgi:hypothetical protein